MAAARAMLDEEHQAPVAFTNDSNTYSLGSIQRHNVVIACLPNAQYGTNNAANVLTNLTRTFPSVSLGLMVGIGGGVPNMADVRLGDVVVGTRVMQYDLGKIVEDGQIRRTAVPKIPHQAFGSAVSAIRSEHELRSSIIPAILREKLRNHSEYRRPALSDHLFAATYEHEASALDCSRCDQSKLAPRHQRLSENPVIHYGVIASGNQVMRSGAVRDNVARQLDALCFEMEAAGLMDILPCLPIRGSVTTRILIRISNGRDMRRPLRLHTQENCWDSSLTPMVTHKLPIDLISFDPPSGQSFSPDLQPLKIKVLITTRCMTVGNTY
ncbi:NACHT and ankyrin domain protein [Colletotrichum tofieldiae]|nr:NACHT and ankyrin domain protein [Colletotrichum tofieldiae]